MKNIIYCICIILILSCKDQQIENVLENETTVTQEIETKNVSLKNFTYEDIARYTMAYIMGEPTKIIKVKKNRDFYIVSYIRQSDSKKFEYKVKFENDNIVWANIDGRWRDSQYDEKLKFLEKENSLQIIQTFSDGSLDIQEYKIIE